MSDLDIRAAVAQDIPALIQLMDIATFGFIQHLFASFLPPDTDVRSTLKSRMLDPTSQLSLGKAQVAEVDGRAAGFVMTEPIPDPANLIEPDTPELLRPLFELESLAPGTTLINFVAAFPEMRGKGVGTALMKQAERAPGPNGMSLTIHDQNTAARHLYEKLGYREAGRRPIVKQGWDSPATDWVLMIRR